MSGDVPVEALDALSGTLWDERRLLDELRFRLEEGRLVAAANGGTWPEAAGAEVDAVLQRLRLAELLRAVWADDVAAAAGLPPGPTLRALADAVPDPWGFILESHLTGLSHAAAAVEAAAAANRRARRSGPLAAVQPRSLVDFLR